MPSTICPQPEEARACIQLPQFDPLLIEKTRVISSRFPLAEAEFRVMRGKAPVSEENEIPHFEKVFRLAADMASVAKVTELRE